MKRNIKVNRCADDPLARRQRRLHETLIRCVKPIVWLRAGPGSGKTRLLRELTSGETARHFADWLILDGPTSEMTRLQLKSAGAAGDLAAGRVLIASREGDDVARVLLGQRLYGFVEVIDDAALFVSQQDCRTKTDREMFAATGGWPVLVDAWISGRSAEMRELLPDFLIQEMLPAVPRQLATALYAALNAPLTPAAVEFLFKQGPCVHPLLRTAGSETTLASSWVHDALLETLNRRRSLDPAVLDELTDLFANFTDPVRAVLSLLQIGQGDQAIEVFKRSGGMFFGYRHGYQALEQVLKAAGPDREQHSEDLFFARLWLMIKCGQPREALLRLEARYPGLPVDLRRMRLSHRPYAVLLRVDISLDIDETPPVEVIASWGRLQALLPPGDDLARGLLFNTMAIGFLQADALLEAEKMAEEALAAYQRTASPYLAHFMLLHLCEIALRQSRSADASDTLQRAEQELRHSGLAFNSEPAIVASFKSRIAYEEGRFVDCPADTEPILQALLQGDSWPDLIVGMAAHFVLTAFWGRGLRKALERLDHFALTLSRRHGPTQHLRLQLTRIRLLQVARRHAEAGMRLEEYDLESGARRSAHLEVEERLIRLRHLISLDRISKDASRFAAALAGRPELEMRQKIALDTLQAYIRHCSNDHALARRHLRRALRNAESRNLLGVLAEDGEFLEALLPPFIAAPGPGNASLAAFAQRVLRLLKSLPAAPMHSKAVAGVSRQEHRVLSYLIDGYTNKQIARALRLSDSTIKFHLRSLFRKLDVSTRSALSATVLQRGIVT
jgi:DNA-binding CsgD family transcriptional regulator